MFENSMQEYYLEKTRKAYDERKKRLAAVKTRKDALAYVAEVHEKIKKCFNLPKTKCPLNVKITGEHQINGITIKNVIYESRKDYPVTALLFMPEGQGKHPASLVLCGHAENGKACGTYQVVAMNLCKQGFVVLLIDPLSQGERHQFVGLGYNLNCCLEHNMQGKQQYLAGEYFGAWRAWDAIRGIDYLMTLPEVDTDRIGVTGNSGGGTMTTFVNALDDRLFMASPSCYVTTWRHEVENELPADIEQMPPHALEYGLDMADFIIAQAPRPTLIMGQKNDFFDPRGTVEACEDAKRIYKLLGAEDNVKVFIGPDSHGYNFANRETMYAFFNHHAQTAAADVKEDKNLKTLPEADTFCTPDGEVYNMPEYRKCREFTAEYADKLAAKRKELSKEEMRKKLTKILKTGKIEVPYYRILRTGREFDGKLECFARFGIESEPGRVMSVLKYYRKDGDLMFHIPAAESATLYVSHLDSDVELIKKGYASDCELYGLDVRGIGELQPSGCDARKDFFAQYLFDYHFASLGNMFGEPILGGKVRDVLLALELLNERGVKNITLAADGLGTIPALIAAVLSDIPVKVKLDNMPESWMSMAKKVYTLWPLSYMLEGIFSTTDLDALRKYVSNLEYTIADEPAQTQK
ncbi:MAG: acetylxylan esterase [Lentisphaeria bacterium]|nr:acetylxylan esterase [Lentisphaeria bacterium]